MQNFHCSQQKFCDKINGRKIHYDYLLLFLFDCSEDTLVHKVLKKYWVFLVAHFHANVYHISGYCFPLSYIFPSSMGKSKSSSTLHIQPAFSLIVTNMWFSLIILVGVSESSTAASGQEMVSESESLHLILFFFCVLISLILSQQTGGIPVWILFYLNFQRPPAHHV